MSNSNSVQIRFFEPPVRLRRYFNAFYLNEVSLPPGETFTDFLMPSWGLVGFNNSASHEIVFPSGDSFSGFNFAITGPFTRAARLTVGSTRNWGLGLLPMGWVKFIGAPAKRFANRSVDGHSDPAFSVFQSLASKIFGSEPDSDGEFGKIADHFLNQPDLDEVTQEESRIAGIYEALQDASLEKVSDLAERANLNVRTLERACNRAFGFPPKSLLRRQRFLRSMEYRRREPNAPWTDAMDDGYHDQSQFVREFRQFMGMSPSEYALLERPLVDPLMKSNKLQGPGRDNSTD